ncbi:MAG: nucleoid occlusion protein [Bacillus thermozeamaize]|uniref:Nucleoid occlusion protein n=1 Tax=Bacillus thermozeamaize TaxID=230954 RepID=A0A1Y3PND2_9BACI|nr:MAG: nucleoid occlusion protein [Bacillus thermozeamaize]
MEEVKEIPVELISPNPYQPRTVFDDERIEELSQTIRTHGVIQPIVVRELENGKYELIAGERRLRAVKKLNLPTIPAIVRSLNDAQAASIALIENLQREGLTAIEEAYAYQQLLQLHGLTQESLAQRLGKGQSTIANKLRLLNLPESVQHALMKRQITERHARALLSLPDAELQEKVLSEILQHEWNVKQTEQRVKQYLDAQKQQPAKKSKRIAFSKDVRLALNTIRQSVKMITGSGMNIDAREEEHEEYVQFIIRIPKK